MSVFRRFTYSLVLLLIFALSACSDSEPVLTGIDAYIVLDYPDESSVPSSRLSVFAQTNENVRRVSSVRALHKESGQEWVCQEPRKISDTKRKFWAGYTNFVPAEGSQIPSGKYEFFYEDMAGRQAETAFSITYDESLLSVPASELKQKIGSAYKEKIALYNAEGLLMYYGDRKEKWKDNKAIRNEYSLASSLRICYIITGSNAVCMMPGVEFD